MTAAVCSVPGVMRELAYCLLGHYGGTFTIEEPGEPSDDASRGAAPAPAEPGEGFVPAVRLSAAALSVVGRDVGLILEEVAQLSCHFRCLEALVREHVGACTASRALQHGQRGAPADSAALLALDGAAVPGAAAPSLATHQAAIAQGLSEVLDMYRSAVLGLEQVYLQQPDAPTAAALHHIAAFRTLLPNLHELCHDVLPGQTGCRLARGAAEGPRAAAAGLASVLARLERRSRCGIVGVEGAARLMMRHVHGVFLRQVAAWVAFGRTLGPAHGFFIRVAGAGGAAAPRQSRGWGEDLVVQWDALPPQLPRNIAWQVVNCGRGVRLLRSFEAVRGSHRTCEPLAATGCTFGTSDSLRIARDVLRLQEDPAGLNWLHFEQAIRSAYARVSSCVLSLLRGDPPQSDARERSEEREAGRSGDGQVLRAAPRVDGASTQGAAAVHLHQLLVALKDYALLGRGDLWHAFLQASHGAMQQPYHARRKGGALLGLKAHLNLAAAHTGVDTDHAFRCFGLDFCDAASPPAPIAPVGKNKELVTDDWRVGTTWTLPHLDSWDGLVLTINVQWPLGIALPESAVAAYQALFQHLLRLRRVLNILEGAWWDLRKPRAGSTGDPGLWRLRQQMANVLQNILMYTQIDVIEVGHVALLEAVAKAESFVDVQEAHKAFLERTIAHSLLDVQFFSEILSDMYKTCIAFAGVAQQERRGQGAAPGATAKLEQSWTASLVRLFTALRGTRVHQPAMGVSALLLRLDANAHLSGLAARIAAQQSSAQQ
ncbi:unnamed protein product [Pedinophyceae sp. YPF-701]|nr:unnamed protein product [Pedinophyceae sp. YPF-701]